MPTIRVALAGNPNSGKSAIFNALTRSNQHVGNYAGVTVEKRTGTYRRDGDHKGRVEVVDLPGTYSLNAHCPEERIAEETLLSRQQDVVVVVADSTTLSRALVLLSQLMLLVSPSRLRPAAGHQSSRTTRLVLCLNMADEAAHHGQVIDLPLMQQLLGMPVVETVGHKRRGTAELKAAIEQAAAGEQRRSRLVLGEQLDDALAEIEQELAAAGAPATNRRWRASRLLLGRAADTPPASERAGERRARIEASTGDDIALYVARQHQAFVDDLLREVVTTPLSDERRKKSEALDALLVNRVFGLPIFLLAMYAMFWLTFTVGEVPMGWIEGGFELLGSKIAAVWPKSSASQLRSLVLDGAIAGVGGVVVFLPNIVVLFFCLSLLEDTGYMARAAFLVDRLMHRFGLHGKSFVPLLTGFGCSIPGIMATRTLDNEKDRLTTMLVVPLMSCGARLPIWALLIPAFFPAVWRAPVLLGIYLAGILLALALALLLRRSLLRGEDAPFVMELPPYRLPTLRAMGARVGERSWLYLRKAGTVILALSILMWFLTHYPRPEHSAAVAVVGTQPNTTAAIASAVANLPESSGAESLHHSYAGRIGHAMEPLLAPLGLDGRIGVALIGAFAAKEVFVAQMGVVYALGEVDGSDDRQRTTLQQRIARDYTPLQGISLMLFLLIATPCMATVAVTRRESGSWRWAALQIGGLTAVAYVTCLVVYQIGRLFV